MFVVSDYVIKPFEFWNSVLFSFGILWWNEPRLCCNWISLLTILVVACLNGWKCRKVFFGWGVCCEVTSVNSVIRQAAGGSVRHQLSDQTLALCHAGVSNLWMLDLVHFCESEIFKKSRINEHMGFYTHLIASGAQLKKKLYHSLLFQLYFSIFNFKLIFKIYYAPF